ARRPAGESRARCRCRHRIDASRGRPGNTDAGAVHAVRSCGGGRGHCRRPCARSRRQWAHPDARRRAVRDWRIAAQRPTLLMARRLYALAWWFMLPWLPLRLWWRGRREPGYREHIGERFGRYDDGAARALRGGWWIHAVSVGETRAAAP